MTSWAYWTLAAKFGERKSVCPHIRRHYNGIDSSDRSFTMNSMGLSYDIIRFGTRLTVQNAIVAELSDLTAVL